MKTFSEFPGKMSKANYWRILLKHKSKKRGLLFLDKGRFFFYGVRHKHNRFEFVKDCAPRKYFYLRFNQRKLLDNGIYKK